MTEQRNRKHIVMEAKLPAEIARTRPRELDESETLVTWLDDEVVAGASQLVTVWYLKATPDTSYPAHTHDSDEVIGFFGSDAHDPQRLGGEIEFWLEDERYLIDRSCVIYVPKGMQHGPLVIRRVDSPIFHFTAMIGGQYVRKDVAAG